MKSNVMKQPTRYLALILAVCLIAASSAFADKDKDDKDKKERQSEPSAVLRTSGSGPDPGQCTLGLAQKELDVNNVRARLFNIGSIGYGHGTEAQYVVPQSLWTFSHLCDGHLDRRYGGRRTAHGRVHVQQF